MAGGILGISLVTVAFYFLLISANFRDFHSVTCNLNFLLIFITDIAFLTPFETSAAAILIIIIAVTAYFRHSIFFYFISVGIFTFLISLLFCFFSAFLLILELISLYFNDSSVLISNYKNIILLYIFSILYHTELLLMANKVPLKFS